MKTQIDTTKKHYRAYNFDVSECKQMENEDGIEVGVVRGYASTFGNVDRFDDVIVAGAFTETLKTYRDRNRMIRMLWTHRSDELIGGYPANLAREDEKGLFVEGQINLETQRGREAYSLAKQGVLEDFSIGFRIKDATFEIVDEEEIRKITEVELFEVSLVGEPMNQEAQITQVKADACRFKNFAVAARDTEWDAQEAFDRCVKFLGTKEAVYQTAMIFPDRDGEDQINFCLLDVIEGKLTIIPKAVFDAAAYMYIQGKKLDISSVDQEKIEVKLEKYYDKMGLDSPFSIEKSFRIHDFTIFTERNLEKMFKKGVVFTNDNAKAVVSAVKSLKRDVDETKNAGRDAKQSTAIDEIHNLFCKKE